MSHTLQCSQSYASSSLPSSPTSLPKTNIRFKCLTCATYICKVCAELCHRALRHDVVFHGRTEFECDCGVNAELECRAKGLFMRMGEGRDDDTHQTGDGLVRVQEARDGNETAEDTTFADSHGTAAGGAQASALNRKRKSMRSTSSSSGEHHHTAASSHHRHLHHHHHHQRHFYNPLIVDSPYHTSTNNQNPQSLPPQWCTYMLTATYQTYQVLYACRTCQKARRSGALEQGESLTNHSQNDTAASTTPNDPDGSSSASKHVMVCELCRTTCHAGHDVDTEGVLMQALCDCGAGNCVTSQSKTREFCVAQNQRTDIATPSSSHTRSHSSRNHRFGGAGGSTHHHSHQSSYIQQPFIEPSGRINCRNIVPKIRINAPPKTGQHVCIIDGDSLLVFAGAFEYVSNDMYEFNFVSSAWFRITQQGEVPGIRSAHSGCKHGNHMYIFGGVCGSERYNLVYRFNLSNYRWERLETTGQVPQARYFTSLVAYEDSLYCVGGMLDDNHGDSNLYRLNLKTNTWIKINTTGAQLPRINGMSVVVHEASHSMLVFGGYSHGINKFSNTLYSYNFKTSSWSKVGAAGSIPHRRAYHTAMLGAPGTPYQHSMFLFGGKCPISLEKDRQLSHEKELLYEYKIKDEMWVKVSPSHIENVFFHQAVEHDCCLYFFGGNNRQNECFGFFCFNLNTQEWSAVQGASMSSSNIRKDFLYYLLDEHVCADLCIEFANGEEFLAHSFVVCRSGALKQLIKSNTVGDTLDGGRYVTNHFLSINSTITTEGQDEPEEVDDSITTNTGANDDNNSTISDGGGTRAEAASASGVDDIVPHQSDHHSFEPLHVKLQHSEDPLLFQQILFYLYGSEHLMVHQPDVLLQLLKRAQAFELGGLVEKASRALERFINTDLVIGLLTEAHDHKLMSLKNKCIAFISKNYDEMINMPEIAHLPPPVLLEVARSKGSNFQPSDMASNKTSPLAEVSLLEHLRKVKASKEHTDVILVTSDHFEIGAHRGVLAAQCEYFRSLFTGKFAESFQRRIKIDIPKRIVDIILHFFYTGELSVDQDESLQLLMEVSYYSDWILFESLERVCQDKLMELISADNIMEVLRLCSLNRGHKFVDIIKSRAAEEFKKLDKEHLIRMFVEFATESSGASGIGGASGSNHELSMRELTSTDAEEAEEDDSKERQV